MNIRSASPQKIEILARDLSRYPHGEAGTGERVPFHLPVRKTEVPADLAHLVLEQEREGLDQVEVDILGQPSDVMMRFYRRRRPSGRSALDHVRIQRPLGQKREGAVLQALLLEYVYEALSYDLPLRLRVADPGEPIQKLVRRVDEHEVGREVLRRESPSPLPPHAA